ncbi:hypothetical protein [Hydrogenophaga sp. ANAO-22]
MSMSAAACRESSALPVAKSTGGSTGKGSATATGEGLDGSTT